MNNMQHYFAEKLLSIEAVSLQPKKPFTWSSGIKSPIYCDNRLTLSYPVFRKEIAFGLVNRIKEHFSQVEVIAGTATAGIPHAAWVSDVLGLPMCYVRSKKKEHGKGNQIEGKVLKGQKVVVVEDLISTGGSSINAVKALMEVGCEVLGVVSIFTYEIKAAADSFAQLDIPYHSLTSFSVMIEVALEKDYIDFQEYESLKSWNLDPAGWSGQFA